MSNYQHPAVHFNSVRHFLLTPSHSYTKCPTTNTQQYISIQYATSCSLPHTRTQIVQLPTHSSTFQLSTPLPADPSHSHTKCPTTNTQQYIQFSKSLPADPLTLPHKMSNYQHTAVNFNSLRHFLLTPSHSHTKCPTANTKQYISIQYATSC